MVQMTLDSEMLWRMPLQSLTRSCQPSVRRKCIEGGCLLQCSSYGESISTLGFGSRVSEITLGQAKKNSESAQIFEAKDQIVRWALELLVLLSCKHLIAAIC